LAAFGLVLTAGVQVRADLLGYLIFAFVLPMLSSLILSMWFAAHERVARASFFLTGVEQRMRVREDFGDMPMWETWLRAGGASEKSRHFWSTEYSGVGIFIFLMVCPSLIALF